MARLIWTEPAVKDLDTIAEYIALDKPDAAQRYVQKVFTAVERLSQFPRSGSIPPEIPNLPYRQVIIPPCRVFYRFTKDYVFIIFVMRSERNLRQDILTERDAYQSNQRTVLDMKKLTRTEKLRAMEE